MSPSTPASSHSFLQSLVIDALLSGNSSPSAIMKHIGPIDGVGENDVLKLLRDPSFLAEAEKARETVEDRVIQWFKKRGLAYAERMHELSKDSDPRVAFQATKDVLDRMGASTSLKLQGSTLDAYKALIRDLQPAPATKEEASPQPPDVPL